MFKAKLNALAWGNSTGNLEFKEAAVLDAEGMEERDLTQGRWFELDAGGCAEQLLLREQKLRGPAPAAPY